MISGLLTLMMACLMSFGQSGIAKQKSMPAPQDVTAYAPEDAEYFGYLHWQSVIPGLWQSFQGLGKELVFQQNTKLATDLKGMQGAIRTQLSAFEKNVGLNLVADIEWVGAWVSPVTGNPDFLVVLHGRFPSDLLGRLSALSRVELKKESGASYFQMASNGPVVALADGDTVLAGAKRWVLPRIASRWKPVRTGKKSLIAQVGSVLKKKPALVFGSVPSKKTRGLVRKRLKSKKMAFVADTVTGHEAMTLGVRYNGFDLTWQSLTKDGHKTAVLGIEGALALLRASHPGMKGIARFGLAALRSYAARDKKYRELLRYEQYILDMVDQGTGNGRFKAKFKASQSNRLVSLSATDKSITRIFPISAVIPVAILAAMRVPEFIESPPVPQDATAP